MSETKLKPAAWLLMFVIVVGLLGLGLWSARKVIFPEGATGTADISREDLGMGGEAEAQDATGITTVTVAVPL